MVSINKHKRTSPESAAKNAAILNTGMGAAQVMASAVTGNLGFIGESVHNLGDGISFEAKRRAIIEQDEARSRKIRQFAATVFALGGAFGISAGSYEIISQHAESSSPTAVAIAIGGAAINTMIARKTHRAVVDQKTGETHSLCDHDHSHEHEHSHSNHQNTAALIDTKIHALSDAGTGWIYVGGLLSQKYGLHDAASYAVLLNGVVSSLSAGFTMYKISK